MGPFLDFQNPLGMRTKESPDGLPPLNKYRPETKDDPIVLDAGSWQFRAGFASKSLPACNHMASSVLFLTSLAL